MTLLMNHINSVKRDKLNGKFLYEAAKGEDIRYLMGIMGLRMIPADEVNLSPGLLKK